MYEQEHTGFFPGEDRALQVNFTGYKNSFAFQIERAYYTDKDGVFSIEARLEFNSRNYDASYVPGIPWLTTANLKLHGFWSLSSREMCLVWEEEGNKHSLTALLKLSSVNNSSNATCLITGTLWIFHDMNHFGPIPVVIVPNVKYEYSYVSTLEKPGDLFAAKSGSEQNNQPLNILHSESVCSIFSDEQTAFPLKYASSCSFAKDCHPFSGVVDYVPYYVSFVKIDCSDVTKRLRVLVEFPNGTYGWHNTLFDPNTTLVGEGFWDDKKNELYVVLCRFLGITESWSSAHIGDCTTRLSLSFPAVLSIRQSSRLLGQIWSTKEVNDSGYFKEVVFSGIYNHLIGDSGMKYEYSEISRVKKLCSVQKAIRKDGEEMNGFSHNMNFYIALTDSEGHTGRGSFTLVSFGNQFYDGSYYSPRSSWDKGGLLNISYNVDFTIFKDQHASQMAPYTEKVRVKISAEGVYDSRTGRLCMVGCKNLKAADNGQSETVALDCDILLDFQLFSMEPYSNRVYAKEGIIESLRKKESDPLYFDPIDATSDDYREHLARAERARVSIRRMNLETTLALLSNTLSCLFVWFQLYHVKKNPQVLPSISMVMLSALSLGNLVPLVLVFETTFSQNHHPGSVLMSSWGWRETFKVIVRIFKMTALLLQCRIFQLTWSAKSNDGNRKSLILAEVVTLFASLPSYAVGAFIAVFVLGKVTFMSSTISVANFFLLPQLLLNMLMNSKGSVLTPPFYFGTTLLSLPPHLYNLYLDHIDVHEHLLLEVVPQAFASGDIIISLSGLMFAAVIVLQQKFGGRCILPQRFRERDEYEKALTDES